MTPDPAFAAFWRRALAANPDNNEPPASPEVVEALAPFLGRPLARHLAGLDVDVDPEEAAYRRLMFSRHGQVIAELRHDGLDVLPIKGWAVAGRLYTPGWVRTIGDLDLLLRPDGLASAVNWFQSHGYRLLASSQSWLGVTSDISFHPLVSADGVVQVDLHIAPDAFPLSRALSAEAVFRDAVTVNGPPAAHTTHTAVIAVSNLAKERFAPRALRQLIDLGRLAAMEPIDWAGVSRLARAAGLHLALNTATGALRQLGTAPERLPATSPGPGIALARRLLAGRLEPLSAPNKLWREAVWCYAPATLAAIWARRITGLLAPRSGDPRGSAPIET